MRVNVWVLLLSFCAGVAGVWFLFAAFDDYLDATRSYTQIDMRYEEDSFQWLDAEYEDSEATLTIINRSDHLVTVRRLDAFLYFGEDFAGADYESWQSVTIDPDEAHTFTVSFQTTTNTIQDQGGEAELRVGGRMSLEFDEISEPLHIRYSGDVGQVDWEGA